jgi:low temperature requirement protein LtrA
MKKFLSIWFNRVSGVFYLGAFLMFLMLFCDQHINIVLLLAALAVLLGGGAYVTEELKHTEGEKIFLQKLDKLFG